MSRTSKARRKTKVPARPPKPVHEPHDPKERDPKERDPKERDPREMNAAEVLARTIYGEARGEPAQGRNAVAAVVMNRVARANERDGWWWGRDVSSVCLKPYQFSCWNEGDPNRAKILNVAPGHRVYDACLKIALRAVTHDLDDPSQGATHYHARGARPPWARGKTPVAAIGKHLFYADIE